jgi:2,4-dichlorophenol 6-monooxygenase
MRMGATGVGPDAERVAAVLAAGGPEAEAERARLAAAIAEQVEHFDYLNQELGYAYDGSPAIIDDGTPAPEPANPIRDFEPSARPGARAAHAWLRSEDRVISTLDLFDTEFVLLSSSDRVWPEAATRAGGCGVPIRHELVDPSADPDGAWAALYDIGRGAVLVRPDGHVAWRVRDLPDDPAAELADAVHRVVVPPGPTTLQE